MSALRWLSALLLALALAAGATVWLQRQAAAQLRDEIAILREQNRELARLRTENQRLAAALPSAAELEALRADHAAVVRLRSELERTKDNLQVRERALAEPPAPVSASEASPPLPPPALTLAFTVGADGKLSIDGAPFDLESIKPRLAALPKGTRIEIRLQTPKVGNASQLDAAKQGVNQASEALRGIIASAKELGLQVSARIDQTPKD